MLEARGARLGVVNGVQGFRWFQVAVLGREDHAGGAPLGNRSDALLCAAKIIVAVNEIAGRYGAVATTGIVHAFPGSFNTVPGRTDFTIDLRHPSDAAIAAIDAEFRARASHIAAHDSARGCRVEWHIARNQAAVTFDPAAIACVRQSAHQLTAAAAGPSAPQRLVLEMQSGAGHDSCSTSAHCPTAMVFVPSRKGISHAPDEYTAPDEW